MLLPAEHKVLKVLEYFVYIVCAVFVGIVIAVLGMTLPACARQVPVAAPTPTLNDENFCMHEAAKRIIASTTCEEAYLKLLSLGVTDLTDEQGMKHRCGSYFSADAPLMTVLVCENGVQQTSAPQPSGEAVTSP